MDTMGDLSAFDLQEYIDNYNCWYYVEAGSTEASMDYALRFPFYKLYTFDENLDTVEFIRQRWWFQKNRVQAFHKTHPTAFYELVRMIPSDFNAVVWLFDLYLRDNIEQLAQARPAKTDVIIINDQRCLNLGDLVHISKSFGLTHIIKEAFMGSKGKGIVFVPIKLYNPIKPIVRAVV